jgi:uncharacterized protein
MRKLLFITLFLLSTLTINLFSQENQSILKLQGISVLSVKPTVSIITYDIRAISLNYVDALKDLANRVNILVEKLKENGFSNEEIITSNYSVSINNIYRRGSRTDSGYVASQTIKIEFDYNEDKLLEILNYTSKSNANPSISIAFSITKEQKINVKNQLIKLAVKDAYKKANLIVEAADYKLDGIVEISYGINAPSYSGEEVFMIVEEESAGELGFELSSFNAADLTFTDQVFITFKIIK